jgi:hypothetical protein
MKTQSYTAREITMSWRTAFLRGIPLTLPPVAVVGVIDFILRGFPDFGDLELLLSSLMIMIIGMLICVVAAAIIPYFGFALLGKNGFRSIRKATACKFQYQLFCVEPIKVSRYCAVTLTPLIFGGILPYLLALFRGDLILTTAGGFLVICFSPNAYVYSLLCKEPKGAIIEDSKTLIGGTIYTPLNTKTKKEV